MIFSFEVWITETNKKSSLIRIKDLAFMIKGLTFTIKGLTFPNGGSHKKTNHN